MSTACQSEGSALAGSDSLIALAPIVEVGDESNELSRQHQVSICNGIISCRPVRRETAEY